jgi:hypothetical protein
MRREMARWAQNKTKDVVVPFVQLATMAADRAPWSLARTAIPDAVSKFKGMG